MNKLYPLISGFIFAVGLAISQMTHPNKVLSFLNLFGEWDPSLLVVLLSAVSIYGTGYFLMKIFGNKNLPAIKTGIDKRLLLGSTLFGIGWGLVGLCPGPALVGLATGNHKIITFILAMSLGMLVANKCFPKKTYR
jgi:uncharacterized membrane protein YedE/YeeE